MFKRNLWINSNNTSYYNIDAITVLAEYLHTPMIIIHVPTY